jgi:hypothetical protein
VTGTWYHLAVTFTSSSLIQYVNGVASTPKTTGATGLSFVALRLGSYTNFLNNNAGYVSADCVLDDVRVYNTALTAAQIQEIYASSGMPSRQVLSGAPLFNQLSAAAASSAVGAFSLRAVNGVTAKAVAVQGRPVVQWPPAAMTSNTTALTGQVYGNGTYTASSNNGTTTEFNAFDYNTGTIFGAGTNYLTGAGTYIGPNSTTISGTSVSGDWLQIQLPTTMTLRRYDIVGRQDSNYWQLRNPTTFWIAGSTNGTTWSNVHYQSGLTPPQEGITITVPQTTNAVPYSYYRMVVSVIGNGTGTGRNILTIASWNLYGEAAAYVTRPTTDFWADSQGNLLTAPVTGQLLQNWLGGAIGYVTTWYDQSGQVNDATQSIVANQPNIVNSPTGNGYVPNFVSPGNPIYFNMNANLNLGAIDGSYTKSVWTYVTSNVSQFQNFLSTSVAVGNGQGIHLLGWNFQNPPAAQVPYVSFSQNTYAVNLTSCTFPLNTWTHIAATYNNPTQTVCIYLNGTQVYSNTAFTASFNAGDGASSLGKAFQIGKGNGSRCTSQNYDVAIFNTALSASDIKTLYNARYQ